MRDSGPRTRRGVTTVLLIVRAAVDAALTASVGGPGQGDSHRTPRINREVLAQFHAAEYASERNSVDVWKTLQYALIPIIFVVWTLLVEVHEKLSSYWFWWLLAVVVPLCFVAYQKAMVDALTGVLLIEERIRPSAIQLAGSDAFWFHEPTYRTTVRPDWAYAWFWPPLLSFVSAAAGLVVRLRISGQRSLTGWWRQPFDLIAFATCLLLTMAVWRLARVGLALNKRIDRAIAGHGLSWHGRRP